MRGTRWRFRRSVFDPVISPLTPALSPRERGTAFGVPRQFARVPTEQRPRHGATDETRPRRQTAAAILPPMAISGRGDLPWPRPGGDDRLRRMGLGPVVHRLQRLSGVRLLEAALRPRAAPQRLARHGRPAGTARRALRKLAGKSNCNASPPATRWMARPVPMANIIVRWNPRSRIASCSAAITTRCRSRCAIRRIGADASSAPTTTPAAWRSSWNWPTT